MASDTEETLTVRNGRELPSGKKIFATRVKATAGFAAALNQSAVKLA